MKSPIPCLPLAFNSQIFSFINFSIRCSSPHRAFFLILLHNDIHLGRSRQSLVSVSSPSSLLYSSQPSPSPYLAPSNEAALASRSAFTLAYSSFCLSYSFDDAPSRHSATAIWYFTAQRLGPRATDFLVYSAPARPSQSPNEIVGA